MVQAHKRPHDPYAEFAALPEHMVGEIVNGTLSAHPRPSRGHGRAATGLTSAIAGPFDFGNNGPGGWKFIAEHELHLGPHIVVPDISSWRTERYRANEATSFSVLPPDWLCEVLSPSTKHLDRFQKLAIYAHFGVAYCWYVDPLEKSLEIFILVGDRYQVGPAFTGNDAVCAVPFEPHTFNLGSLWDGD